jgi:hypothetical protein
MSGPTYNTNDPRTIAAHIAAEKTAESLTKIGVSQKYMIMAVVQDALMAFCEAYAKHADGASKTAQAGDGQ